MLLISTSCSIEIGLKIKHWIPPVLFLLKPSKMHCEYFSTKNLVIKTKNLTLVIFELEMYKMLT